jgi:hypothetical protein
MSPVRPRAPNESGPSGAVIGDDRGDDQSTDLTIARPGDEGRRVEPFRTAERRKLFDIERCSACGVNLPKSPAHELCYGCSGEPFPGGSGLPSSDPSVAPYEPWQIP